MRERVAVTTIEMDVVRDASAVSSPTALPTTNATASASSSRVSREAGRSSARWSNSCAYWWTSVVNATAGDRPFSSRIVPP